MSDSKEDSPEPELQPPLHSSLPSISSSIRNISTEMSTTTTDATKTTRKRRRDEADIEAGGKAEAAAAAESDLKASENETSITHIKIKTNTESEKDTTVDPSARRRPNPTPSVLTQHAAQQLNWNLSFSAAHHWFPYYHAPHPAMAMSPLHPQQSTSQTHTAAIPVQLQNSQTAADSGGPESFLHRPQGSFFYPGCTPMPMHSTQLPTSLHPHQPPKAYTTAPPIGYSYAHYAHLMQVQQQQQWLMYMHMQGRHMHHVQGRNANGLGPFPPWGVPSRVVQPGVVLRSIDDVKDAKTMTIDKRGTTEYKNFVRIQFYDKNGHKKVKHKCNFCSREFAARSNMIAHVRTHTGEKPFRCETCDKCFTQKSNLKRHAKMHLQKEETVHEAKKPPSGQQPEQLEKDGGS